MLSLRPFIDKGHKWRFLGYLEIEMDAVFMMFILLSLRLVDA